jgi:hypothetical protein
MAGLVAWYNNADASAVIGSAISLASMLRWIDEPAMNPSGHSHANITMPKTRLITCKMGRGLTATSRFLVRKSQNIFGQKKPSIAAAIWSVFAS